MYEVCNYAQLFDIAASLASVDTAFITELVVRLGYASATEIPKLIKEMKTYTTGDHPNYFMAGVTSAKVASYFGWATVDN